MKIGSTIKRIREAREWSLDDLSAALGEIKGADKPNLWRIETQEQWPRPELLEAIAKALNVSVYQIFALAEGVELPSSPGTFQIEEEQLISMYRAMEEDQKAAYLAMAKAIVKPQILPVVDSPAPRKRSGFSM
jgi:transcriptional regulator with XRE-family HTH domain